MIIYIIYWTINGLEIGVGDKLRSRMGRMLKRYLNDPLVVGCRRCRTHLTSDSTHLVSRAFQGATGRASLYGQVVNVRLGPESTRQMTTGVHVVCDVQCCGCEAILGWYYVQAFELEQRYKEGKWCLERALTVDIDNSQQSSAAKEHLDDADYSWVVLSL